MLRVKTWGTRGSLPRASDDRSFKDQVSQIIDDLGVDHPDGLKALKAKLQGDENLVFGGNTSCVQISSKNQSVIFDMGTGLRDAGTELFNAGVKKYHIFLTHLHWDHIMGFPFFLPAYDPGCEIHFYHVHKTAPEYVKILFNGINFPVKWEDVGAKIEFHALKLYEPLEIDDLTLHPFNLDHPGGSFGYRVENGGKSVVIGYDSEYKRLSKEELGKDYKYYQDLDAILFDAQYEMQEYASRFDWGHCTPTIGTGLALREGIRNVLLTHHDPWASDKMIRQMAANAQEHVRVHLPEYEDRWREINQAAGPNVIAVYDGYELTLGGDA